MTNDQHHRFPTDNIAILFVPQKRFLLRVVFLP